MANEDVIRFELLGGYRIKVWFKDGESGEVDVSEGVKLKGFFAPLKDMDYFRRVSVNAETFVLQWPNGAEIDPLILYSKATGKPIKIWVRREEEVVL